MGLNGCAVYKFKGLTFKGSMFKGLKLFMGLAYAELKVNFVEGCAV